MKNDATQGSISAGCLNEGNDATDKAGVRADAVIEMKIIARIRNDFPSKFGIPRQSGVVRELKGRIVFEPEYRNPDALRGIEGFDYLWLIWQFSEAVRDKWSPTVRPPILGGNTRMGVFATRSPFRPNAIGLSSVRLEGAELHTPDGPVLHISGADLMDGTPILDIKPYLAYVDSHPEAAQGFRGEGWKRNLQVDFPEPLLLKVPADKRDGLLGVLAGDPRPTYHDDPERIYGMPFGNQEIRFRVAGKQLIVLDVT
ncbi:tRNA (N6-threonylcarbamoyladenosine(37)-N6)-methyltransferase TrmO [Anaerovibrio sp.]|uniref:tRNA (N6-threonylcarbamoyladenosine(37)-N6)-methyltransferase TrmO n=1 Tax=Anaerovibrio sp. TaxID=1872532 RepID=UPI003F155BBB